MIKYESLSLNITAEKYKQHQKWVEMPYFHDGLSSQKENERKGK